MRPIDDKLRQICRLFRIPGNLTSWEEIKVGNVNRTYKVTCRQDGGRAKSYIVQRINTYAFRQPVLVMENIDKVTEHIRAKCPDRVALHFHHTADRKNYVSDEDGFWRLFNYVPSVTYNTTENLSVIRSAGEAFGDFQTQLGDFDVQQLHYTIPDFHDTRKRYAKLKEDAAADPQGRAGQAREEIDWLLSVEDRACALTDLYDRGELPLRVTHNDTKINNVLFDAETDRAIVVIDLDTVMPGLVGHDFGDAIRFAANYVEEDSPETERAGGEHGGVPGVHGGLFEADRLHPDGAGDRHPCSELLCPGLRAGHPVPGRLPPGGPLLQDRLPRAQPGADPVPDRPGQRHAGEAAGDGGSGPLLRGEIPRDRRGRPAAPVLLCGKIKEYSVLLVGTDQGSVPIGLFWRLILFCHSRQAHSFSKK